MRRIVIIALVLCGGCDLGQTSAAKEAVKKTLRDPESAQFEDVSVCPSDAAIIQGNVNAKNGMGGYVGFEPFFVEGDRVIYAREPEFSQLSRRCFGRPARPENDQDASNMAGALEESANQLEAAGTR